jgi:hypothetical protein
MAADVASSASSAKKLTGLMAAGQLDAVAAHDASQPDRFVAALLYPNAELLVIAAKYDVPPALQLLLDQKKYRDVYGILQTSPGASEQVFFIDMLADGLSAESADVLYEPGNKQTVFDETWRKQHALGEHEYLAKFETADTLYTRLLQTLIDAVAPPLTTSR